MHRKFFFSFSRPAATGMLAGLLGLTLAGCFRVPDGTPPEQIVPPAAETVLHSERAAAEYWATTLPAELMQAVPRGNKIKVLSGIHGRKELLSIFIADTMRSCNLQLTGEDVPFRLLSYGTKNTWTLEIDNNRKKVFQKTILIR